MRPGSQRTGMHQLGRSQGSDDLGFDFRVEYGRQTWQIEVKAKRRGPAAFRDGGDRSTGSARGGSTTV